MKICSDGPALFDVWAVSEPASGSSSLAHASISRDSAVDMSPCTTTVPFFGLMRECLSTRACDLGRAVLQVALLEVHPAVVELVSEFACFPTHSYEAGSAWRRSPTATSISWSSKTAVIRSLPPVASMKRTKVAR